MHSGEFAFAQVQFFETKSIQRLHIIGVKARVHILGDQGSRLEVRISSHGGADDLVPKAEVKNGEIFIEAKGFHTKKSWEKVVFRGKNVPDVQINIKGPSLPLRINLLEGDVVLKNWKHDFLISQKNGKIKSLSNKGEGSLHLVEGQVEMSSHIGNIKADLFRVQARYNKVKGEIWHKSFSGDVNINHALGTVHMQVNQGKVNVIGGKGNTHFDLGEAEFHFSKRSGLLKGKSLQGTIRAILDRAVKVSIQSKTGDVLLQVPHTSAARVDIGTQDGKLVVPQGLRTTKRGVYDIARGRLKGQEPGRLFVRTETGGITLKLL